VAKEFDTSWFDLKNYEKLQKTSIVGWANLLCDRYYWSLQVSTGMDLFSANQKQVGDETLAHISEFVDCIKTGDFYSLIDETREEVRSSVYDLSMLDALELSKDRDMIRVQPDRCKEEFSEVATWSFDPWAYDLVAKVNVDLSATDEQIRKDFDDWLAGWRNHSDVSFLKIQKKLFTQADFDYWVEYGVIPYLDLVFVARVEGKKITQNQLARLIFPHEYDVDPVERIRKVTKPTAERLINNEVYRTLFTQSLSEKEIGIKNA
jgi:hypothetical protein